MQNVIPRTLLAIVIAATVPQLAGCTGGCEGRYERPPPYSSMIATDLDRGGFGEPLATLDWLAGSWVEIEPANERNEEHWVVARGGLMLGVNRTLRGPRAVAFEFLRIEARDEDAIVYVAQPGGRSPGVEFTMTEWSDTQVVFENPEHDFPDRIAYARDGDRLSARVEGKDGNGGRGGFTLEWVRAGSAPE